MLSEQLLLAPSGFATLRREKGVVRSEIFTKLNEQEKKTIYNIKMIINTQFMLAVSIPLLDVQSIAGVLKL